MTQSPFASSAWYRPMIARHAGEEHRTATALELFFDLCFVAAVAQAAATFEHEVAAGRAGHGLLGYALVFFAIWWAWMNFTWFASAYDTDDVPYRLLTLVQITGALVMAAGVNEALEHGDFTIITWGYVVMRLAMVSQWLRAAHSDGQRRRSALRYALGIFLLQIGWLARLIVLDDGDLASFAVLVLLELAVPVWAEGAARTTWHPHHIAERYGLFTLIVLGESVTAATLAVRTALDTGTDPQGVLTIGIGGVITVFALWWLYFAQDAPRRLTTFSTAMLWGYGHYPVFATAAAVGAGLAVNVARVTGHSTLTDLQASASYTVPVAAFIMCVWLLHGRSARLSVAANVLPPVAALAVLAGTFTPAAVLCTGIVASLLVGTSLAVARRETGPL
ncbi:low temperature requirement protein A [Streptomyces sp. CB02400]|uniref:low temperature requirement protein A n=1 Tax=Streptomyces sp. CB02400 TaxID=1703944 RepID=UPI00093F4B8A|nr:low temperature requirement protein A [Streptomyces sp. CB02400]OKK05033.1 low temperature requirement protein A [Streptomyces sp. CB02400]